MNKPRLHMHPLFPGGIEALEAAPEQAHATLQSFSITSDSIVATVVMLPDASTRVVQIHWGDDEVDTIDFRQAVASPVPGEPPGSVKRQHVYRQSTATGQYPNRVLVTLAIYSQSGERSFEAEALDITPRFRCFLSPTVVRATHHDTGLEEVSEFDVMLRVQNAGVVLVDKQWRWEPKTFDIDLGSTTVGIVAERVLEGSNAATEVTLGERAITIWTRYVDDDGAWGILKKIGGLFSEFPYEFDGSADLGLEIDPLEVKGPFSFTRTYGSSTEFFEFQISGSMDVIAPIDPGPVLTFT